MTCNISDGYEVLSGVTGGRPLSFSRLISGGGKTPLQINRRKDQAESLGTTDKIS